MSEWTFEKACAFVNMDHPAIASLLYDLDLLPEQISSDEKRVQMILIVAHFITAENGLRGAIEKHRRALEADNPGSATLGHESYDDELYAALAPRKEGEG